MARTKASVGAKVSSGKSSKARCSAAPPPSNSSSSGSGGADKASRSSGGGGNPVCPQPTPKWQRPITNFFIGKPPSPQDSSDHDDEVVAGTSKTKKRHIIESDDEHSPDKDTREKPVNVELDETIELEPLSGEKSHKIEEYYPKNDKNCDNGESHDQNGESHKQNGDSHEQNGESHEQNGESHDKNEERHEQNGESHEKNGESHEQNGESHEKNGESHEQNGESHGQNEEDTNKVNKGKGKGKKTNKENVSNNNNDISTTEVRKSIKRDNRQEDLENSDRSVKRVKLM